MSPTLNTGTSLTRKILYGVAGLAALIVAFGSWTIVGTGKRGVVTHFGKVQQEVMDEGFHFKLPIVTSVHKISVQIMKSDLKTQASSKDLQLVTSEVAINWHILPSAAGNVYQSIGDEEDVVARILTPAVQEVFKATTSKKTAEEMITRRSELAEETKAMLALELKPNGIVLDNISVVDLEFTREFSKSIEDKQIAEQHAKRAEFVAQQATADAKAKVNTAKGDAEATLTNARAQAESQKLLQTTVSPAILQLKAIEKWDGSMPQFLGSGGQMLFNIPAGKGKSE